MPEHNQQTCEMSVHWSPDASTRIDCNSLQWHHMSVMTSQITATSDCLLNSLFKLTKDKTWKLHITDPSIDVSPVTDHDMMTSSNGNTFSVTGSLCEEFPSRLNKRLSKQSWGWWFKAPSRSLWRHCNKRTIMWKAFSCRDFLMY